MVPAAASWNGVVTILGIGLEVRHLNTYLPTDVSISSLQKPWNDGQEITYLTQKYLQKDTMVHRLGPFLYETNLLSRKDR